MPDVIDLNKKGYNRGWESKRRSRERSRSSIR